MDLALIHNLRILAELPENAELRIVSNSPAVWPPDPGYVPESMTIMTHSLHEDERWSWLRPVLQILSGDTDHAIVNFLMLLTRALELYKGQPHVSQHVGPAITALARLQDTSYSKNKFVRLALLTCRCAWRQYEI